jgi:hypothetical protein
VQDSVRSSANFEPFEAKPRCDRYPSHARYSTRCATFSRMLWAGKCDELSAEASSRSIVSIQLTLAQIIKL